MTKIKWLKLFSRILKVVSATAVSSLIMAETNKWIVFWVVLAGALGDMIVSFIKENELEENG